MCELTLATVAAVATVAGGAISAAGAIQQGNAAKAAGKYQAQVAENNKILAERAAKDAERRGELEAQQQASATRQLIGRQRAVLAGQGTDVGIGSALDITSDTAEFGKLDALTIRSNAAREALGYRNQGANFQAQADLSRAAGANAQTAGFLGAGASVLSSAGGVAQKWYNFKKTGLWQ